MSHSTVLVLGDDVEQQLAPFQENNMGTCPQEYLEFVDCTAETREYFKRHRDEYTSLDEYAEETGCIKRIGKNHRVQYGYIENPNAKWDWYQVGGRWSGQLILKPGCTGELGERSWTNEKDAIANTRCDSAFKDQIDFDAMWNNAPARAEAEWTEHHSTPKAAYVAEAQANVFWHDVLIDGIWRTHGQPGWFGARYAKATKLEWSKRVQKLLLSLPDDTLITMVDYHI